MGNHATIDSSKDQAGFRPTGRELHPANRPRAARSLGRELRAMYVDLARQPVPQRLLDLLGKLEETKG